MRAQRTILLSGLKISILVTLAFTAIYASHQLKPPRAYAQYFCEDIPGQTCKSTPCSTTGWCSAPGECTYSWWYCCEVCGPTPPPTPTPTPGPEPPPPPSPTPPPPGPSPPPPDEPPIPNCPIEDCSVLDDEPHPLRPYPCRICGPEADRTIGQTDAPYCAMRPWAAKDFEYLKNEQGCPADDPNFPCVKARNPQPGCGDNPWNLPCISGTYTVDLSAYELPLVSVTRSGFDFLTFFNRAQEHLADYLEGRSYYNGEVEPVAIYNKLEWMQVFNKIGVLRKLTSTIPTRRGEAAQDTLKIRMINNAGTDHHNYIVGYRTGNNIAPWGTGSIVRLRNFIGNFPPLYTCSEIADEEAREACFLAWMLDYEAWTDTIYGKLWPYVPMFTREDAKGFVRVFPEPGQPFTTQTAEVSIPHLPRLDASSTLLQQLLSSPLSRGRDEPEILPYEGIACPAGPWYLTGAACTGSGGGCGDIEIDCNQSASATDSCVFSQSSIENLALSWVGGSTGNHVSECYNDVIAKSRSAGVNAAFAILIWLNESNASNYNLSRQDFGINNPAFECSFTAQINQFLTLPGSYRANYPSCFNSPPINPGTGQPMTDMEAFLWIFRTGDCNPSNSDGQSYAAGIINRWNWVSSCSMPGYP